MHSNGTIVNYSFSEGPNKTQFDGVYRIMDKKDLSNEDLRLLKVDILKNFRVPASPSNLNRVRLNVEKPTKIY